MPVIQTGIYPHMPIDDHREIQIVYNTGHHRASSGLFSRHTWPASVQPVSHITVQYIISFSIFDLGAYPWAKVHQKGR